MVGMQIRSLLIPILAGALSTPVAAEVVDSAQSGFTLRQTVAISAAPMDVYAQLIRIGEWWSSSHTFSGDAKNLSIEERAGGCFCEKLPKGGGVRHMEVVNFVPGKKLVMHGTLGPLQSMAAVGSMSIDLAAEGIATKLTMTYAVAGYAASGFGGLAGPVDGVLREQFASLKETVEKGSGGTTSRSGK